MDTTKNKRKKKTTKKQKRMFFNEDASFHLTEKKSEKYALCAVKERMKEEKKSTTNCEFNDFERKNIRTKQFQKQTQSILHEF